MCSRLRFSSSRRALHAGPARRRISPDFSTTTPFFAGADRMTLRSSIATPMRTGRRTTRSCSSRSRSGEAAVRRHLGARFALVDEPEASVMRIRLAITEARASDPILDVLRARSGGDVTPGDGALDPETRRFIEHAQIEGDIRDARTNRLLAAGVDRRRREGAPPIDTWADVDRALDLWAKRMCTRLEARTREHTSELQSHSGSSYAVFCLIKKT